MDFKTINIVLDVVLIAASIWMVVSIRGVGGIVGQTLTFITVGAVILGFAHLLATLVANAVTAEMFAMDAPTQGTFHRVVVLLGFASLIYGFYNMRKITG